MRDKVLKYAFWLILGAAVLWAFDTGMKKQQEIDCAHGRYCNV